MGAACSLDGGAAAAFASVPFPVEVNPPAAAARQAVVQSAFERKLRTSIPQLPRTELSPGQVVTLQGREVLFNDAPPIDSAWLNGALTQAEWQADLRFINAASLDAAILVRAGGVRGMNSAISERLTGGREFIRFHTAAQGAPVTARRIFLWYEADDDEYGWLYWNEVGATRTQTARGSLHCGGFMLRDQCVLGKGSVPLQSPAARLFPASACFHLQDSAGKALLSLAAPSRRERDDWVMALHVQVHNHSVRHHMLFRLGPTVREAQVPAVTKRVEQLNKRYEGEGRGEQVKWFFQAMPAIGLGGCQLTLRCRPAAGSPAEAAPPSYAQAVG